MTNIDNNVPIPPEKPKRQTRARKPKTTKESPAAGLIAALNFIALAQQKEGTPYQTHCRIENNWILAFNGTISIGAPIQEDLKACPRTLDLITALSKCGETLSITQLNEATLRISSEKFRATIDCLPSEQVAASYPDLLQANIGEEIKAAFEALAWIATENAQNAYCASVMLQAKTAVATNRHVLCEYWHGYDLPPDLLIPKQSITALLKITKKITGFGYTPDNSCTFWFEDGSYLKTQLFKDQFPKYEMIFERAKAAHTVKMPEDFFKALEAVAPLSKTKFVHFHQDKLCSESSEELGASYDLAGLPGGLNFNYEYLRAIQAWFDNVKFPDGRSVQFAKGMLRGAVMAGIG